MNFVVLSMNGTWIKKMRAVFLQARVKYRVIRKIDSIDEINEPSIWIIDVDTIENLEMIGKIKNSEDTMKLYLSSVNIENAGINYPKFDIIPAEITTSEIFRMMQDNKQLYDALIAEKNNDKDLKTKEEAIKELPKTNIIPVSEELDDEEDDMLAPLKPRKISIDRHDAIYEDEEEYKPFEDRSDMLPSSKEKIEEISVSESVVTEETKETEIPKQSVDKVIEPVKKVLYENNERADKNLKESEYVSSLGIYEDPDMRCPIIRGKPIEYIGNDVSNTVDAALSRYRIKKLLKTGLDKWGIINEINKVKKREEGIRMESLKEREMKRMEFLKRFDDSKIDVSKVKKVTGEDKDDGTKLKKDLGIENLEKPKPTVASDKFMPSGDGEKKPVKIDMAEPKIQREKIKTREEILKDIEAKKKEAKDRRLLMDVGSESIEELQKKRRDEIRQKAEREVSKVDKPGLPDLPSQKLTDRNQMAALYKDKNIKRAESRTELKTSISKPKDVAIEVDDDDDMIDTNKKKKGFFGFGKK